LKASCTNLLGGYLVLDKTLISGKIMVEFECDISLEIDIRLYEKLGTKRTFCMNKSSKILAVPEWVAWTLLPSSKLTLIGDISLKKTKLDREQHMWSVAPESIIQLLCELKVIKETSFLPLSMMQDIMEPT